MAQLNKKRIQTILLFIFFLFIIGYGVIISYGVIFGVKIRNITINNNVIQTGMTVEEKVNNISGNAKNAINLTFNGREISINKQGNFNETIALFSGYNILSIVARDKFGNVDTKTYKLIYKQQNDEKS
ncbi:MAG: hypothetical protein M3P22_00160 [bacterium]|nr:hypothetical protein [bacterium]